MFRKRAKPGRDRKYFAKSAARVHKKNFPARAMRGGNRL